MSDITTDVWFDDKSMEWAVQAARQIGNTVWVAREYIGTRIDSKLKREALIRVYDKMRDFVPEEGT